MIKYLMNTFALTDQGAKRLQHASFLSFVTFLVNMVPICLVMFTIEGLLEGNVQSYSIYAISAIVIDIVMRIAYAKSYDSLYTAVYSECKDLRINAAKQLKDVPLSYLYQHDLTDLSQITMADISSLEHAFSHAVPQTIGMLGFLIVISVLLIISNWKLGLCIVIPVGLSLLFNKLSFNLQRKLNKDMFDIKRTNSQQFQNAIELQKEIKNYNLKEDTKKQLNSLMEEREKVVLHTELCQGTLITLASVVLYFIPGIVILIGIPMVQAHETSVLYLIGFILASVKINDGLLGLYLNFGELMHIDAPVQRLKDLYNCPIQSGIEHNIDTYDIVMDHVTFGYNEDRNVINDISCKLKANEVTALIGPSGCGKSTILKLISRLYDYNEGNIFIDETPINIIDPTSMYSSMSIVFQDVVLFNTSVYNNIRLGNENASKEEVLQAASLAGCDEFIERFEDGYDTLIGENGSRLSGGERQRISIARAFLKNAPIIILDEITSNLDVENENIIQTSLQNLIKDKTVIIISHRLKSVKNCDTIVVLNEGRLVGYGDHNRLIETCPLYQSMIEKSKLTEEFHY